MKTDRRGIMAPYRARAARVGLLFPLAILVLYTLSVSKSVVLEGPHDTEDLLNEYLRVLKTSNLAEQWSQRFTSEPHLTGQNMALVEWQMTKFEEYGLENVQKESFEVLMNFPVNSSLSLLQKGATVYKPSLVEDCLDEDPTTQGPDLIPAFHGYSANGNVTGQYIYANYGRKEDFDVLVARGVKIQGRVVVVRYGHIYRGLKVKHAQELGAIGVLIYSDPGDYGKVTEENGYKSYPDGPASNPSSIQRGSVMFLSQIPGDPTTPGWASKGSNVKRVDPHHSIPKIPSLPISFKEVEPILRKLNGFGPDASQFPSDWAGLVPNFTYSVGPSPEFELNLYNNQQYNITPLYNVMGEIPGKLSDEVILVGNHRDAWIKGGASDPNSGSASMLEILRALNHLQQNLNWKPLRTIRFISFDGEEPGLIGSTEYGEMYAHQLQQKVVAYLNLDSSVSGTHLNIGTSPLLRKVLLWAAARIEYPKSLSSQSLYEHFFENHKDVDILGSGSDYTVFFEHLGIPSFDVGFGGADLDPVYHYHSNYDSHHWMKKFGDPGFVLHNTMSQYLGAIILKLSENKALFFGLADNSRSILGCLENVSKRIPQEWLELEKVGELLNAVEKSARSFVKVSEKMDANVVILESELEELYKQPHSIWNVHYFYQLYQLTAQLMKSNAKIKYLERLFLTPEGLNNRPWFKHMVYASGRYTGYEGQYLPGLQEALEDGDLESAKKWLVLLNNALKMATQSLHV